MQKARPAATQKASKARAPKAPKDNDRLGEMIGGSIPLASQYTRIGGDMSPRMVSAILREADNGRIQRMVDLTYESRSKSGHMHGVLQLQEAAISCLGYEFRAREGSKAKSKKAAKELTEVFAKIRGWQDGIHHMVSAGRLFSLGFVDVRWTTIGGRMRPVQLKPIPARQFFYEQTGGELRFDPNATGGNLGGVDLRKAYPVGKVVGWQPHVIGDVPWRDGIARPLLWPALFTNWAARDWLTLAELSWKPWREGIYKKGADPNAQKEEIERLRRICEQMAATGVAVHSDAVQIVTSWPKNNVGTSGKTPHQMLIEFYNNEMSKVAMGATDIIEPGPNGARSSTEVRERMNVLLRESIARGVAEAIQRDLVEPFCLYNYGANVEPPVFTFQTDDSIDVAAFSKAVRDLVEGTRITLPASWVRSQVGAPEPKGSEEVIGGPEPEETEEPDQEPKPANSGDE